MFSKTMKERIALIGISVLSLGYISVVNPSIASAALAAPAISACTSGDKSVTVTFSASVASGGDTIDKYQYSTNNGTNFTDRTDGAAATALTMTITDLSTDGTTDITNGTSYQIKIRAADADTNGTASAAFVCTPGIPNAGELYLASAPTASGSAATNSGIGMSTTSLGWISKTSTNGSSRYAGFGLSSGNAGTAVVQSGAKLSFAVSSSIADADGVSVVVSGGSLSNLASTTGTLELNGSATTATNVQGSTALAVLYGVFNVSAAAGSTATISAYNGTSIDGLTSATSGSLIATWTLTVASASASGAYSASQSTVTTQAAVSKGTIAAGTNAYDTTDRIGNGSVGIIYMELDDAYAANITSGVVAASATNGATVKIANAASDTGAEAYAASSSFDTLSAATAEMYVYVNQPVANTAGSTTVTLTLDGTTVGTKTLNWSGDIASISILSSTKTSFVNGVTVDCAAAPSVAGTAGNVVYSVKDAAGNAVTLATSPTVTGATGALIGATVGSGNSATAAHGCIRQTSALGYGAATMIVPSTSLQGAGTFKLRVQNSAGVNIDSAAFTATVSNGATDKFVASWDKASYAPGELATLTIKALDAYGNPMAAGNVNTGLSLSVASGFTAVGTACADTTLMDSAGAISCKYAAGNTEGSYSYSIDLTTATSQDPTVGALAVKASTATVSNAEVLKSIVALIASINKQIQALQKLILKR